jgi:hypothetical protein
MHRIISNNVFLSFYSLVYVVSSLLIIDRRNATVFGDYVLKQRTHTHLTICAAGTKVDHLIVLPFDAWTYIKVVLIIPILQPQYYMRIQGTPLLIMTHINVFFIVAWIFESSWTISACKGYVFMVLNFIVDIIYVLKA